MNARIKYVCLAALAAALPTIGTANAQMIGVEPIALSLQPGQVFEQFFPNEFDPFHPKKLTFNGILQIVDQPNMPADVEIWFDWFDLTGMPVISPPEHYIIDPFVPPLPIMQMFTIPFCPQQVSLHIQNNGPGGPVIVEGIFTHECIPEPSTMLLGSLAAVGLFAARRRGIV